MPGPEDRAVIRRYLLGDVPAETAAALDERLLADEAFYEQVMLEEDAIAEQYVRGHVPAAERERIESFLAAPERQRNVALTRALAERFAPQTASAATAHVAPLDTARRTPAWVSWAAAASLLMSTGTAVYFLGESRRLDRELSTALRSSRAVAASPTTPPLSLVLTATAATRSAEARQAAIVIPADAGAVQLQLQIPGNDTVRAYTVEVRRAGGGQVWGTGGGTIASGPSSSVAVTIPGSVLVPDDYVALVSSPETATVAEYQFRVVRR